MVHEIDPGEPTATCHLQIEAEQEALCGYPWECLIEVPDRRDWHALDDCLKCDICEDEAVERALEGYRRAAAVVFDGDEQVGCLGVRVVGWREELGPFWRRRRQEVGELPQWVLLRTAPAHPALPHDAEGGVVPDEALGNELRAWSEDTFTIRGTHLRLRWLSGNEIDRVHREVGWMD